MISGIQGQLLEVTVMSCSKLKDTQLIGRQDPFVSLEYSNNKFRTKTCTDGGKNPTFEEKFQIPLIEGLHEMNIVVWNSNTFSDTLIGSGRVQLRKVLSDGYDDNPWMLQTQSGKYAGEAKLILHFPNARNHQNPQTPGYRHAPSPGPYYGAHPYQTPPSPGPYYGAVPYQTPPSPGPYYGAVPYQTPPSPGPYYGAVPYQTYPPAQPAMQPPPGYPPHPVHQTYVPRVHAREVYPPHPHMEPHPPTPHRQTYYPPGPSTGFYPPPY